MIKRRGLAVWLGIGLLFAVVPIVADDEAPWNSRIDFGSTQYGCEWGYLWFDGTCDEDTGDCAADECLREMTYDSANLRWWNGSSSGPIIEDDTMSIGSGGGIPVLAWKAPSDGSYSFETLAQFSPGSGDGVFLWIRRETEVVFGPVEIESGMNAGFDFELQVAAGERVLFFVDPYKNVPDDVDFEVKVDREMAGGTIPEPVVGGGEFRGTEILEIERLNEAPVLDGKIDEVAWNSVPWVAMSDRRLGGPTQYDCSARFKAGLYVETDPMTMVQTKKELYILAYVLDGEEIIGTTNPKDSDSLEVFLDLSRTMGRQSSIADMETNWEEAGGPLHVMVRRGTGCTSQMYDYTAQVYVAGAGTTEHCSTDSDPSHVRAEAVRLGFKTLYEIRFDLGACGIPDTDNIADFGFALQLNDADTDEGPASVESRIGWLGGPQKKLFEYNDLDDAQNPKTNACSYSGARFVERKAPQITINSVTQVPSTSTTDPPLAVKISYDVSDADSSEVWVGVAAAKEPAMGVDEVWTITPNFASLEGDFGNVTPGTSKEIIWYAERDLPNDSGTQNYKIRLMASDWPSDEDPQSTTMGAYTWFRNSAARPNMIDCGFYDHVDNRNKAANQAYTPLNWNGEPVDSMDSVAAMKLPYSNQPDAGTREWMTHCLRQMVDAGYDYVCPNTFGRILFPDHCDEMNGDTYGTDDSNPWLPSQVAKVLSRVLYETDMPLKVALMVDTPGIQLMYQWDQDDDADWCAEGTRFIPSDDKRFDKLTVDEAYGSSGYSNGVEYFYYRAIKDFYDNFNNPETGELWTERLQTHNDLPLELGGRPLIKVYAAGPWVDVADSTELDDVWADVKSRFKTEFNLEVEPFIVFQSDWWSLCAGSSCSEFDALADGQGNYLGDWLDGDLTPDPDFNTWIHNDYRWTRVSPGVKFPDCVNGMRWRPEIDVLCGKRHWYVDQVMGSPSGDEDYFLMQDWALGVTDARPGHVFDDCFGPPHTIITGHWDEFFEGEMVGLMDDYLDTSGATGNIPADYYLENVWDLVSDFGARKDRRDEAISVAFQIQNPNTGAAYPGFTTGNGVDGIHPLTVLFLDRSRSIDISASSLTAYEWDFDGDSITDSTERNPCHEYTSGGCKTVTLTIGSSSYSMDISVVSSCP